MLSAGRFYSRFRRFRVGFASKIQSILQRGVTELCSNDGGCSLFILSLMAPAQCGVNRVT